MILILLSSWNPLSLLLSIIPIPGFGWLEHLVDKMVVVVISFFMYKVLNRELVRYNAFLDNK